jgi:hypothetical protein
MTPPIMILVYGILVIGAVSSFLNYRLQKKWFDITHKDIHEDTSPEPSEPSVSERKL